MFRSMAARIASRLVLVSLAGVTVASASFAQEHPKGEESKQEHPKTEAAKGTLSLDDLAAAIQSYVESDSKLKGGYFLVYDGAAKKPLALELVKVHRDRLSKVGDQAYFACADFQTLDGAKPYDLDIFMKGPDKGHLVATQVLIHKEGGKERYTWYEEGGIWKRKEVTKQ